MKQVSERKEIRDMRVEELDEYLTLIAIKEERLKTLKDYDYFNIAKKAFYDLTKKHWSLLK